ncbi:MAG: PilZ domain-containing protein [Desulfobacterales bacterium]|nr:PilZ domain-containing protein [Desulfobacterales bacterium]
MEKIGQQEAPFQVLVKDLSSAGIGFLLKRTEPVIVNSGDRLVITEIKGANAVEFLTHSALVVEWVVDTEILDHIGFGCSFNNLDKTTQSKLDRYVLDWR